MEVENSLYGTLCNFFSLISSNKNIQEGNNTKRTSHFVGTEIEFETEKRNRAKSNAFKTLFSVHASEEQESSHEHELNQIIFNLKTSGLLTQATGLEIAIQELEKNGCLDTAFPVIKLLLNINPLNQENHQQLKKIVPETTNQSPISDVLKSDWHLFPMFEERVFQAPKIDYNKEEPYLLGVKEKLNSMWWMDRLDSEHCHLFGALSNPPKSLDRLGITSQSLLTIGLKSNLQLIERETHPAPHSRAEKDEGYESPNLTATSPLPQLAAINYWEDLENLCNPTRSESLYL